MFQQSEDKLRSKTGVKNGVRYISDHATRPMPMVGIRPIRECGQTLVSPHAHGPHPAQGLPPSVRRRPVRHGDGRVAAGNQPAENLGQRTVSAAARGAHQAGTGSSPTRTPQARRKMYLPPFFCALAPRPLASNADAVALPPLRNHR